jgi:hypothetical protein
MDEGGPEVMKLLKSKGLDWFSLGAGLIRDKETGKIRTWLNPMEQQKYDAGWMSIQDLRDWAEGKGRCILEEHRR